MRRRRGHTSGGDPHGKHRTSPPGSGPPPHRAPLRPAYLLVVFAWAALACEGGGGTQPTPAPSTLAAVSSMSDTTTVGSTSDWMRVRVQDAAEDPVEGVPVRFALLSGPGAVSTNLAVSNNRGIARVQFQADSRYGTSTIRVDVPSASSIPPLEFEMVTVPAGKVTLSKLGGDDQRAEVETQLAEPFRIEAQTPSGVVAGGIPIVWELLRPDGAGAELSSDTTFTDSEGRSRNLLTLGDRSVEHSLRVYAGPEVASDTLAFTATALKALSGPAVIDSVTPSSLRAGEEAVLRGRALGHTPDDTEVRVEGVSAELLEVDPERIRIRVPDFTDRCLPRREVGLRAVVRGEPSNGLMVDLRPAEAPLGISVGGVRTFRGSEGAGCLQFSASDEFQEYLLAVGTTAPQQAGVAPLRLILRAGEETGPATEVSATRRPADHSGLDPSRVSTGRDGVIRERARRHLQDLRIASAPMRASPLRSSSRTPSRGDTLRFHFAVDEDLSVSCTDTTSVVRAVVRAAGDHFLLAEDVRAPAGGFGSQEWDRLRRLYDETVFPTDSAYFGAPADIDANGRIVALFTPRVNRLTPRGSSGQIGGFFLPLDLVDSGGPSGGGVRGAGGEVCPASNEGEVLYLRAADPGGEFGDPLSTRSALRTARSVTAHELMHLLSAEHRVILGSGDFNSLGELWLAEGLAHLAEEVVGLRVMGLADAENVGWSQIIGDPRMLDHFNAFHLDNFARLAFYMVSPTDAPALSRRDPGGLGGLRMRGFAWSFARWLGDRAAGDEPTLYRQLSRGGASHLQGVANVEQTTGRDWEDLLSDYLVSLATDDLRSTDDLQNGGGFRTWNLRSVYRGLHENQGSRIRFPFPYPLNPRGLEAETSAVDFEAHPSTAAFFRLPLTRDDPPLAFHLARQTGGRVTEQMSPAVTVIRIR